MRWRYGVWACVLLTSIAATSAAEERGAAKAGQVVYLDRSADFGFSIRGGAYRAILLREIARQALLIAARDELGLSTRDAWLDDANAAQLRLQLTTNMAVPPKLILYGDSRTPRQTLLEQVVTSIDLPQDPAKLPPPLLIDIHKYLLEIESFSRTSFVEALKKAGFQGKAVAFHPEAGVPEEIEKSLNEMVFTSQFAAVRRLHDLIRTGGESPARLGALVRAYANLGVLTEFHWHPAHKLFKARALLYAQRLIGKQNDPLSRLHLGYALGMAGMLNAASGDLANGKASPDVAKQNEKTPLPVWAELMAAHCEFNLDPLQPEKVDPRYQELTRLLRYLTIELATSKTATVREGLEAVDKMPECYRIHDGTCTNGGVASQHRTTLAWIMIVGAKLYSRVAAMPGLPEPVAVLARKVAAERAAVEGDRTAVVKEFPMRAALVRALLETEALPSAGSKDHASKAAPDLGEPSWASLGHMIQELSFMQVWRRVYFQADALGVGTDEFVELTAPLVEGHPFAPFLQTFSANADVRAKAWKNWSLQRTDGLEITSVALWMAYVQHSWFAKSIAQRAYESIDDTVRDRYLFNKSTNFSGWNYVEFMMSVASASPQARAMALDIRPDRFQESIPAWQKQARDFPILANSFARYYRRSGQFAEAEKWLKLSIDACPDLRTYSDLAEMYRAQGKTDQWISTLEECLKQPDYGLSHGMVRATLARHFMARQE